MPTLRVLSSDVVYMKLTSDIRHSISIGLSSATARVLHEVRDGIEALWLPPYEEASASNPCPISVDVEFSMKFNEAVLEILAEELLDVFTRANGLPSGMDYGVWIKSPSAYLWRQRKRP